MTQAAATGGNVRSNALEGQSQRDQFMKGLLQSRVLFRDGNVENLLQWLLPRSSIPGISSTLPCTPGWEAAMPHPTWHELFNAALLEFDLARLSERVEAACQAIHQHRVQ